MEREDMSKPLGKTIQIFLPDGNPRGVKIAEFTSRTAQVFLVPRAQLEFACTRLELCNVGIYFLIGDSVAGGLAPLYIGEAEDCTVRLKQQNKSRDWWTTALVCVSRTAGFTKSHVKYLEGYCHQQAAEAGRFKVDNSTLPTKSHVSEPMEADLIEHFDTIRILSGTLGYPLFDKIQKPLTRDVLVCKGKEANATGEYTEDGLIVFSGSVAKRSPVKSTDKNTLSIREELLSGGVLAAASPATLRFTKDYIFSSPSQAAAVILGRTANGWIEWKYPDGRTLSEVKRKDDTSWK